MPKVPMNYQNTIIYKIVCNDLNIKDCYVGSTTDFIRRKHVHRNNAVNITPRSHLYVYEFINKNGRWNNWEMIEVEKLRARRDAELKLRVVEEDKIKARKEVVDNKLRMVAEEEKQKVKKAEAAAAYIHIHIHIYSSSIYIHAHTLIQQEER
jgi:hypothetical protein